jgi:hypothetical protein
MYSTLCSVKLKVGEFVDGLLACLLSLSHRFVVGVETSTSNMFTYCMYRITMYVSAKV